MRFVLLGCGVVAVPWLLAYGMAWIARRCQDRRDPVHRLIAEKGARLAERMPRPDWALIERAGRKRWYEVLTAQARHVQVPPPEPVDEDDEAVVRQPARAVDDDMVWRARSRAIN